MAQPLSGGTYHVDLTLTSPDGTRTLIDGNLEVEQLDVVTSTPPVITTPPVGTSVAPGGSATLTVVATGTPPLAYQWLKTGVAVPGATNATYSTGPLTTTSIYAVQVANAVGTVTSNPVTVTVVPVLPTVGIGLTFVRTIGLPPMDMAYAYGDCTGRIVGDQVRLLFTGSQAVSGSPVYEVGITDDPVATFIQAWYEPYHGKRGTWVESTSLFASAEALHRWAREYSRPDLQLAAQWYWHLAKKMPKGEWWWMDFATASTPALNAGHYYHAELDLLYVTFGDSYNVAGRPDWGVVAIRLHPDGTSECWGPWRFTSRAGDGLVRYGQRAASLLRPHPGTGTILGAAGLGSGNVGCPWGTNLVGGAPWMTPTTPVGPTTPDIHLADCALYGYYMGLEITSETGVATGPVRSTRRPLHPYIHEPFPGTTLNFVNPAAYGGIGSWTDNDSLGGFEPLPDRTYFFAGVAGSPIQDPHDPHAAHCWYANGMNNFTCTHGFPSVPAGITGPGSTARFPAALVYATAELERVRRGELLDWQPEPTAWSNLETEFGIVTAPVDAVGCAKSICGGFFDPRTRELYCIAQGADRGVVTWGLVNASIHVFRVA